MLLWGSNLLVLELVGDVIVNINILEIVLIFMLVVSNIKVKSSVNVIATTANFVNVLSFLFHLAVGFER